jgi:ABC-type phosphate transport system substrate-binding protein
MRFCGKKFFVMLTLSLMTAGAGLSFFVPGAFAGDIVVIVNKNNKALEISLHDLRMMYEGNKKNWSDGERITVLLPPAGSEEMHALSANVFKHSDEQEIKKYYLMAIFQQKISAVPASVFNGQDAVRRVANDAGGIAVVKESEIAGSEGIRAIRVSGL